MKTHALSDVLWQCENWQKIMERFLIQTVIVVAVSAILGGAAKGGCVTSAYGCVVYFTRALFPCYFSCVG